MPIPTPHLADHDWASVDTNAHLHRLRKLAASSVQGGDYLQPSVNGPDSGITASSIGLV
jgi:hypothetical protein